MHYFENKVIFQPCDMLFLKKFGIDEATKMIEDFYSVNSNNLPFITDSRQLASMFGIRLRKLYAILKSVNSHYTTRKFVQKNGKVRTINEPSVQLKSIQRSINFRILKNLPVSKYAKAYRPRVTIKQNALPHVNKKFLLKMDIKDFFPALHLPGCTEQLLTLAFSPSTLALYLLLFAVKMIVYLREHRLLRRFLIWL